MTKALSDSELQDDMAKRSQDALRKLASDMRTMRENQGWSTAELAKRARVFAERENDPIKLSQQTISAFEQGTAKRIPSWHRYVMMAFSHPHDERDGTEHVVTPDGSLEIEVLPTYAGAGGGGTGEGDGSTLSFSRALVQYELRAAPADLLAVTIEGNSMTPDFLSGDQLLVDKRKVSLAQPGAFCLWDGDGYVVKYVEKVAGSEPPKVRVISRNSDLYSTVERLVSEVQILGRVVWFARRV